MAIRWLTDLEISELSLCDNPANRKKFNVIKQENPEKMFSFLDLDSDLNLGEIAEVLEKYKDDFTSELREGIGALVAMALGEAGEGEEYAYPEKKVEKGDKWPSLTPKIPVLVKREKPEFDSDDPLSEMEDLRDENTKLKKKLAKKTSIDDEDDFSEIEKGEDDPWPSLDFLA
ncbi:MAG TPA: hypothetical protein VFG01_10425 [Acidobacteriota bacterium]|nr:hypothetical protein [Acidobacteriota bacterium]